MRCRAPHEGHHCPEMSLPPSEQWQGQHRVASLFAAECRPRALASFSSWAQEPLQAVRCHGWDLSLQPELWGHS